MTRICRSTGVLVLLCLFLSTPATADERSWSDPADTAGRLDIKSISHHHGASTDWVIHRVAMYEPWRNRIVRPHGDAWLGLWFSTRGDNCAEVQANVILRKGKLIGRIRTYDPLGCGRGDDSGGWGDWQRIPHDPRRPNRRTLIIPVPLEMLSEDSLDSYKWTASTNLWNENRCRDICWDDAPDNGDEKGLLLHQL